MKRLKSSKGFTLMEMLIVVAIIAVLVAIAIPTFTTSLNKARVATDEANIRSGYAAAMAEVLTKQITTEGTINFNGANVATGSAADMTYTLLVDGTLRKQTDTSTTPAAYVTKGKLSWDINIAGYKFSSWDSGKEVTYEYTGANNTVTIKVDGQPGTKTTTATP